MTFADREELLGVQFYETLVSKLATAGKHLGDFEKSLATGGGDSEEEVDANGEGGAAKQETKSDAVETPLKKKARVGAKKEEASAGKAETESGALRSEAGSPGGPGAGGKPAPVLFVFLG
eukprot:5626634-Alexandrium_andersonii.AAC.1